MVSISPSAETSICTTKGGGLQDSHGDCPTCHFPPANGITLCHFPLPGSLGFPSLCLQLVIKFRTFVWMDLVPSCRYLSGADCGFSQFPRGRRCTGSGFAQLLHPPLACIQTLCDRSPSTEWAVNSRPQWADTMGDQGVVGKPRSGDN